MRSCLCVTLHQRILLLNGEPIKGRHLRVNVIDSDVTDICRIALVEPDLIPPGAGHKVAEPLMGDLVGVDRGQVIPEFEKNEGHYGIKKSFFFFTKLSK